MTPTPKPMRNIAGRRATRNHPFRLILTYALCVGLYASSVSAITVYDGLKNPDPARSLDPTYVTSMFRAAFVYFNQTHPGMIPEADEGYWLNSFWGKNPPTMPNGIGWDSYWWDRIQTSPGVPGTLTNPLPAPVPPPPPAPVPTPPTPPASAPPPPQVIDYGPTLQKILDFQQQQLDVQQNILTVTKDTNTHVVNIDRTFGQTVLAVSKWVGQYVTGPLVAYIAAKKL